MPLEGMGRCASAPPAQLAQSARQWVGKQLSPLPDAEFRVLEDHDDGRLAPGFERHVGELHGVSPVFHSGNQMLHMKQL